MLTTIELEKNQKIFKDANAKYNIFTKELEDFLGDDFYIAPSSSTLKMTGCYPGGLLRHLILACKYSIKFNEMLPDRLQQPIKTIVRTTFLSQIGKVFMFTLNDSTISNGRPYGFNDDIVRMYVGERSVYYALKYGVELGEKECQAILNIEKSDTDKMSKYLSEPKTQIKRKGLELATIEEKDGKK